MKRLIKLLIPILVIIYSCNGSPLRQKSPEQLKQELKIREQTNYKDFVSVEYNLDVKFWSGNDVIKGTINNTASIARFKDVVLTVTFLTQTDTELDAVDYVVYKFVEPNSKTNFEIQTKSPKATQKIGVAIKSVVPVD